MEDFPLAAMMIAGTVSLMVCGALWIVFRKAFSPGIGELDAKVVSGFSISDYQPLHRLWDSRDWLYLRRQAGWEPAISTRLMRERRKIYRAYLRRLGSEFEMLHRAARILLVHAPEEQPGMAMALFRQSLLFWKYMAMLELKLGLQEIGLAPGIKAETKGLVEAAAAMQTALRQLIPPAAMAPEAV
jgi:hypothetical protein